MRATDAPRNPAAPADGNNAVVEYHVDAVRWQFASGLPAQDRAYGLQQGVVWGGGAAVCSRTAR